MQFLRQLKYNICEGKYYWINQHHNACSNSIREFELTLLKLKIIEDSSADWGGATHRITKENWAIQYKGIMHIWKAFMCTISNGW